MRLLAVHAHPADAITDGGGALALHAARGDEVTILFSINVHALFPGQG